MEVLGALLDLIDAVAGAVGMVAFWYTWVAPRGRRRTPDEAARAPNDVDKFVREASKRRGSGGACA